MAEHNSGERTWTFKHEALFVSTLDNIFELIFDSGNFLEADKPIFLSLGQKFLEQQTMEKLFFFCFF